MCELLSNLVNSEDFQTWDKDKQSVAIRAVCLACGKCFEEIKSQKEGNKEE